MSKLLQTLTLASITCFAAITTTHAQDKKGDKLGEYDEIIIKRNSNKDGKVTIEIKDGNVLVDGEKMDAYKDGDISVYRRRIKPVDGNDFDFGMPQHRGLQFFNNNDDDNGPEMDIVPGKAVLGVITEKKEAAGATVREVGKGTPAEKAGLKEGDVITQIDADKISEPKELFEKIGAHEPGDKVTVTYLRNKKESKITVALDERKMEQFPHAQQALPNQQSPRFQFHRDDEQDGPDNVFRNMPHGGMNFGPHNNDDVKLGLSVQDTENGEGAVVLSVAPGSAAEKAGFKEKDIITELAGTSVNSTRDITNTYRENKEKGTLSAKVKRDGQQTTLQVQVPKKLHKADL